MRQRVTLLAIAGALAAVGLGQLAAISQEQKRSSGTDSANRAVYLHDAVEALKDIARQDPLDAVVRIKLGMVLLELGEHSKAAHWFAEAKRIDPALYEEVLSGQHPDDDEGASEAQGGAAGQYPVPGPDIIVGDLHQVQRWGSANDITAYSVGTVSCNAGDTPVKWVQNSNTHPVIAQHMYRYKDGRFEMIGQSWVKHGFFALTGSACSGQFGYGCQPPGTGELLGVGCSDPYSSNLNGSYTWLGPKHEINASTGYFPYPYTAFPDNAPIGKRLQVHNDDLRPQLNQGAVYYVEGHYIAADVANAGNALNNASYRRVSVTESSPNVFNLAFVAGHPTVRELPGIYAWRNHDPNVVIEEIDVPNDGRFIVAYRVKDNGDGTWNYEFAVHNFNSDRSAREFALPVADNVTISNVGFRDVPWHSGAPYSNTDWTFEHQNHVLRWFTQDYDTNANANALRWGTLYNFRFDANQPPRCSDGTLGLFKPAPGNPEAMTFNAPAPAKPGDLVGDGAVNVFDLLELLSNWGECPDPNCCPADLDLDGLVNVFDLLLLLANWG